MGDLRSLTLAISVVSSTVLPGLASSQGTPNDRLRGSATANLVAQKASGALDVEELTASADFFADLRAGPVSLHVYVEVASTPREGGIFARLPAANTDAGTALRSNGSGRVQLSELRLRWAPAPRADVHVGLMDLTGFLDVSRIANDENLFFLGAPFVNNPTIAFPDYVLGAAVDWRPPWLPGTRATFALSSSHGLADNPERSYSELFEFDGARKGVFLSGRIRWDGDRWRASLGVWSRSGSPGGGTSGGTDERRSGVFTVIGWASGVHELSLRLGSATRSEAASGSFAGITYLWEWGENALGIGLAQQGPPPGMRDDVRHAEGFLRRRLFSHLYVTASLQWMSESAVTGLEGVGGEGVLVSGMRFSASF